MDFQQFLVLQFLAHLFADYFFQSKKQAIEKNTKGFKSTFLVWHVLIVFLFSWVLSFQVKFFVGAAAIAIIHYIIDGCKAIANRNEKARPYAFFVDQALHLAVLAGVSFVFAEYHGLQPLFRMPLSFDFLLVITGYLICLKPANIFIKEVLRSARIQISIDNELPNAGKLIGILERFLTLTFILIGQFEAVGFLIAAKSILRYRDEETLKTEYVLIGTMLSFGIAVIAGILTTIF